MNKEKLNLSFAAINRYYEDNIISGEEKETTGHHYVAWGDENKYPMYLYSLFLECPTLQSIINASADFVCGDDCHINNPMFDIQINRKGETIEDLIKWIAVDYMIYGGFAINVLRNNKGDIAELHYIDFKNIRSDKHNEVFYYSEHFSKKYLRSNKVIPLKKFEQGSREASSIYYFKNSHTTTYPIPIWGASVISCEIEKSIDKYHLNNINNNFMTDFIVSLNNGVPSEEAQSEIEDMFNEKFSGTENAGRVLIAYSSDKEHAPEILKIDRDDIGERYKVLAERCRSQILTSFRISPILAGITTDGKGFAEEQYAEAFKLYNRTSILPIQKLICRAFDNIFNSKDMLVIEPFTLDWTDNGYEVEEVSSEDVIETK